MLFAGGLRPLQAAARCYLTSSAGICFLSSGHLKVCICVIASPCARFSAVGLDGQGERQYAMKSIHVARLHKLRVEEFENEVRIGMCAEVYARKYFVQVHSLVYIFYVSSSSVSVNLNVNNSGLIKQLCIQRWREVTQW